jgi:ketosteroid isomerase-like protein
LSEANVEAVRRAHAAFQQRDPEPIFALIDPEIEWHEPTGAVRHGRDELLGSWQAYDGQWDQFRWEPQEFLDAGEHVVVMGEFHGRARATGAEIEVAFVHIYKLRHGKVIWGREYVDTAKEARALSGGG